METNEDTTSDRIGDFFAGLLDLETGIVETSFIEPESRNLNETVVCESRCTTDINLLPVVEDDAVDSEVLEDEEAVEVRHVFTTSGQSYKKICQLSLTHKTSLFAWLTSPTNLRGSHPFRVGLKRGSKVRKPVKREEADIKKQVFENFKSSKMELKFFLIGLTPENLHKDNLSTYT